MKRKKDGTPSHIGKRRLNNERNYIDALINYAKEDKDHGLVTRLRAVYHALPGAIEEANAGRQHIYRNGLHRLDGQCGNALARRGLHTRIGAEKICMDFYVGKDTIKKVEAWYAPRWFVDLAHSMEDRRPFYNQMDKLAKEGGDAIDSELGLLILGQV